MKFGIFVFSHVLALTIIASRRSAEAASVPLASSTSEHAWKDKFTKILSTGANGDLTPEGEVTEDELEKLMREVMWAVVRKQRCDAHFQQLQQQKKTVSEMDASSKPATQTPTTARTVMPLKPSSPIRTYEERNSSAASKDSLLADCSNAGASLAKRILELGAAVNNLEKNKRFDRCMKLFKSRIICRQQGGFYLWAKHLSKRI